MRILLADDDPDLRQVMSLIVSADPSLTLLGAAADADEAISLAERTHPDVAILDVRMPKGGGVHAATVIRRVSPHTKIIALSGSNESDAVIRMLRAGAMSYLVKGASAAEIRRAIHDAGDGTPTLAVGAARELLGSLRAQFDRDDEAGRQRAEMRARIERFIAGDGARIVLQPIVDLSDLSVVGYEALSRFEADPRDPDVWFARAYEVGLGAELEVAMLARAVALAGSVPDRYFLSVNLSPDILTSKEGDDLSFGVTPERIVVELTEHAPVEDYARLNVRLSDLRARGMRFAVDDAGAGFASLRHILQIAPEFIKVDTSLTRDIDRDSPRRALAASLITFANEINSQIIAEGIERSGEHDALRDLGVRLGQGYHLARPAPVTVVLGASARVQRSSRIADRVPACKDPTQVVGTIAEILSSRLPVTGVSIRTVVGGNELIVRAAWPEARARASVGSTVPIAATEFVDVVRRDGPVASSDRGDMPPFVEQFLRDEGARSWISIPLHDAGKIIGCIRITSTASDAFPEATADVLGDSLGSVEGSIVALLREPRG